MAKLDDLTRLYQEASNQLSTQTRSIALGFLAISWALLTAHDEPLRTMAAQVQRTLILAFASTSVLVLVCDFFQYIAARAFAKKALLRAGADSSEEAVPRSPALLMLGLLYKSKIVLVVAAFLALVAIFIELV